MSRTIVITQSNYLPWRGFFDLVACADMLVLLDSVQFTRRDWRNRNKIKTPRGAEWISIPVESKGAFLQAIDDTKVSDSMWARNHIQVIEANYRRAAAFKQTAPWLLEHLAHAAAMPLLSAINRYLLKEICSRLGINTPIHTCTEILPRGTLQDMEATDRLVALARASGATAYMSGPAAQTYLDVSKFTEHQIEVVWMQYGPYPAYPQCWGPFVDQLSIIDLLLNCGTDSMQYMARAS